MAHLAQTYVHLRPYELNAELVERLGTSLQERAIVAVRRYYRDGATVDIHIEEGSAKFWITLGGALSALHIGYGMVADYKGFKESIAELTQDARAFGDYMIDSTKDNAGVSEKQVYRTERRLKTPGKIKRLIDKLEKIQDSGLNAKQMNEQLEAIIYEIEQIENDLTEEEKRGFHTLTMRFENLPPLKPILPVPKEIAPDPVIIRPRITGPSPSRAVSSGAVLPMRDVLSQWKHADIRTQPLSFRSSVYVPPTGKEDDGEDTRR